jgi:ubiquinone/menaquinone biosynthesis C-methylase UbiE
MSDNLNWTGERLVTDVEGVLGVAEHLHRYALAGEFVKGKTVLDIASGEGYGSHLLSKAALKVTGVDISEEAVAHANIKYGSKTNLTYQVGSASAIPLEDASVDIVTSFETLEHTTEHEEFLKEIKRVLIPGGMLIMSTPDIVLYKPHDPDNPFHVKELTTDEFRSLIKNYFNKSIFLNQRSVIGTLIQGIDFDNNGFKSFSGDYSIVYQGFGDDSFYGKPLFNLAFACDNEIDNELLQKTSLFNYVPDLLNEFRGSIGLMFELQELKKLANRLEQLENSKSYKFSQKLSKLLSLFKIT